MLILLLWSNSACPCPCEKGICDPSIHKIRCTRLPPLQKLALISKTNENLKLLNPCNGNLHNNYNTAKTVGEDSKTNPCHLNKYNSAYSKNSYGFILIEPGLHILSHYSINIAAHKCLQGVLALHIKVERLRGLVSKRMVKFNATNDKISWLLVSSMDKGPKMLDPTLPMMQMNHY